MVSRLFNRGAIPIKLYLDTLSQPCRALEIFFRINKVPYEPIQMNLGQGEHLREEFSKINAFQKVPVIVDNEFTLTESVAIFRYVCRQHKIADNWYPPDLKGMAKVDEYLEWQHIGLRAPCALYVWAVFLTPLLTGEPPNPRQVDSRKTSMMKACDDLNNVWLKDKPFVTGQQISFADLLAACELQQLMLTDYDPLEGRPNIKEWLERVRTITNPYYDDALTKLKKIAAKRNIQAKM